MSIKIRMTREAFMDTLAWPSRLVRGVPPVPVLGGVLLEARIEDADTDGTPAGVVTMSAYDWQVSGTSSTRADVITTGRALLSGRLLSGIAKVLPDADVELVVDDEEARITAGTAEFVLPLLPVEDYPTLPAMPLPIGQVDAAVWAEAVQRVVVAADPKETDYRAGVLVQIEDGELRLVATDRYRLAEAVTPWQPALTDNTATRTLLVPVPALLDASRAIASAGRTVTLTADDQATGLFGLFCGNQRMTTPVFDLTFPKYQRLIPAEFEHRAVVPVGDLVDAVDRVAVTATAGEPVTLTFEPGRLRLTSGLRDQDGVARDSVPAEFEGDEVTICFDVTRLRTALTTMHAESVELLFNGPTKPGIFRPVQANPDTESGAFLHLLAPVDPRGRKAA